MMINLDRPCKDEQILDKGWTTMLNTHTQTHRWKNKRTGQVSLFLQASRQEVFGTVDLSDQFPSLSGFRSDRANKVLHENETRTWGTVSGVGHVTVTPPGRWGHKRSEQDNRAATYRGS